MEWKEIASVSGKSGLVKVIKPTRAGFVLESIGEPKKRWVAGPSVKVSVLSEISIYNTEEESELLSDILQKIKLEFGDTIPVSQKSEGAELFDFLKKVMPNYNSNKVYASDVKKIVNWYSILLKEAPELLDKKEELITEEESTTENSDSVTNA